MDKKRPDKFKRWMIASFFLIPLILFGTTFGYYYLHTPVKMHILIYLLGFRRTDRWASKMIFNQGERVVPYLVSSLSNKDPYVRSSSVHLLISLGPDKGVNYERLLPQLIKLLSDQEEMVRGSAVWALAEIGSEEAVGLLIKSLSDPDWLFRINVAHALGRTGSEEAIPPLIKALSDADVRLRVAAAEALGKIGSRKAVGPLITCLKQGITPGVRATEWRRFRRNAIKALEKITGRSFGKFYKAGSDAEREAIIPKWLDWWEENKEKF